MPDAFRILAIPGSLRRASFNRGLARAAVEVAPEGTVVELAELHDIPSYNADHDGEAMPAVVREFKRRIAEANALLFATPEYNFSVPGVLKNAIDWASRGQIKILKGKPVGMLGASTGHFGTIRSQTHLRWVMYGLGALVLPPPELFVTEGAKKFEPDGNLTDESVRIQVRELLERLKAWAAHFG